MFHKLKYPLDEAFTTLLKMSHQVIEWETCYTENIMQFSCKIITQLQKMRSSRVTDLFL